ncbi:2'-5' RNA ligase family protein [Quadrisphaera sp. DSM 44207]|uniref:2'-5' RNA ligase family protein n=1 Tax=Quadrisphaera sp. DSM 44207 TaxID=1881057 RepID=UPI00088C6B36|nr:2'-5' RNA ligase family protein [Quadrisphaera sp. DSM 44207]SDQ12091.1 2'-5' RNA ligase [Quadrisphaera sp. DSM 44207]
MSTDEVTIGVAIPVPAPHAEELQRWRADFGDPLAWAIPAHVTLVPPTGVDAGSLDAVREHLATCAARTRPFRMSLSGTSSFRPVSPVVFVRVGDGAGECELLERCVRTGPLDGRRRFPYHPHVTVAHEVDDESLDRAAKTLCDYEADFPVSAMTLYAHGPDGVWRPVTEFLLGAG